MDINTTSTLSSSGWGGDSDESETYAGGEVVVDITPAWIEQIRSEMIQLYPFGETTQNAVGNDEIQSVSDDLLPGCYLKCFGGAIITPGHFYVNIRSRWPHLEFLMRSLQMHCASIEVQIPKASDMEFGYYVAVRRMAEGDHEWHRAKVVEKIDAETYRLRLIDYGDSVDAKLGELRCLPLRYRRLMKAQAVRCIAQVGSFYNRTCRLPDGSETKLEFNEGKGWTPAEGKMFRDLIFDRELAVQFRQKKMIADGKTLDLAWEVFVHVIQNNTNDIVDKHHVDRSVLRASRGFYFHSRDDDEEHDPQIDLDWISDDGDILPGRPTERDYIDQPIEF